MEPDGMDQIGRRCSEYRPSGFHPVESIELTFLQLNKRTGHCPGLLRRFSHLSSFELIVSQEPIGK